jgi:3-phenylpropionate/trans-cinnamate dioxygenase ferredoxin reductase component
MLPRQESAPERQDVLIVGAGHAGAQLAIALRQKKFTGSVTLVGDEPHLPYERPPLSKEYLSGTRAFERMLLRPESFWRQSGVALRLGSAVIAVDPQQRCVTLAGGEILCYNTVVWAAGGRPRMLNCPGGHLPGIHTLRGRSDVDALHRELSSATRVAVIGGGYLGLEAAATLTKLGKQVTVVEALDRVLARVTCEPLSRFLEAEHRNHGVDIRLQTTVAGIEEGEGRASGIRVEAYQALREAKQLIRADVMIVAIGIAPQVAPLLAAGASGGNGVFVDEHGHTSLPGVYAIGDCAAHPGGYTGGTPGRLESVQNASDMAMTVAKAIAGQPEPHRAVPWFWSNQYDLRLQVVGLSAGYDDRILRGDTANRSFSVIYRKAGRVIALDCVNSPRDFMQGRELVTHGVRADLHELADTAVALKSLVKRDRSWGDAGP